MKAKIIIPLLVILSICSLKAQDAPSQHFRQAFKEISAMLEGKQPLDFEKAVFITENAYRDNSLNYEDFKSALNVHSAIIEQFIKANDKYDWRQFVRGNMGIAPDMEKEAKERYRKALANWAIFSYLTDTLTVKLEDQEFSHLPYTYSNDDPFGTADWKNSQTMNLLETQKGNCYSLVTLFKIFSERFKSEANIVTAPQHIYIEHRDPKGSRFNVEVATRSFPDMGSIQTLTYTTREALLNDISMRKLDLKQSVGLNLVYLAKGYEYKNKVKDDEFILACANTALQHDPKNLNALLLKAQVYEQRVMKKQMPSAPYEKMLAEFYKLGYRQMPDDMKEIILSKIQGRPSTVKPTDKTPNTFEGIGEQARVVTLSNGLFEEHHTPQKIVRYGQTIFDTEKSKIVKFLDEDISSYQFDPVVFALSVDPLTRSYPELTPYQFASNTPIQAIDLDGLEAASAYATGYGLSRGYSSQAHFSQNPISNKTIGVVAGGGAIMLTGVATTAALGPVLIVPTARTLFFQSWTNPTVVGGIATVGSWLQNPRNQQILAEGGAFVAGIIDPNPNSQYSAGPGDELGKFVGGIFRTGTQSLNYLLRNPKSSEDIALGTADLVEGVLRLDFQVPKDLRKSGVGSQMFQDALMFFGDKVKSVFGAWTDGDNLKALNDAINSGAKESEAIFSTPTGKWAKSNGFTNYEITFQTISKSTKEYLGLGVKFTKPKNN
ncbi:MAG: hypothetical protein O9294_17785 [Cytophagales bacterium]|nr:hypothetical protein [Cytophagales bacterium]